MSSKKKPTTRKRRAPSAEISTAGQKKTKRTVEDTAKKKNESKEKRQYTWLELMKDPTVNHDAKQLAVTSIDDRMAYFRMIYSMLSTYLDAKGVHYKKPYQQTWKYHTDKQYKKILQYRRKLINQ